MDAYSGNDFEPKRSIWEEFALLSTNEPRAESGNTVTTAGLLIPGNVTIFEGENSEPDFSRRPDFPTGTWERGRLDPQNTIPSFPGPSGLDENQHSISRVPYFRQNQPPFEMHPAQQSCIEIPIMDPMESSFASSYFGDDKHLHTVSSFHPNQLPSIGASSVFQVQSQPTAGTSNVAGICRDSIEASSSHQGQLSLSSSNFLFCEPRLQPCQPLVSKPSPEFDMNRSNELAEYRSAKNIEAESFECIERQEKPNAEPLCESYWRTLAPCVPGKNKLRECDKCDKKFPSISKLERHYRIHTGENPFKCDRCDKIFAQCAHLKRHYRVHTGEKPFKCYVCDKTFTRSSSLKDHCRIHSGEKPFQCNVCGKKFSRTSSLKEHYRIHSVEKPFGCSRCDRKFRDRKALKRHCSTEHPGGDIKM